MSSALRRCSGSAGSGMTLIGTLSATPSSRAKRSDPGIRHVRGSRATGLLRCARNDGGSSYPTKNVLNAPALNPAHQRGAIQRRQAHAGSAGPKRLSRRVITPIPSLRAERSNPGLRGRSFCSTGLPPCVSRRCTSWQAAATGRSRPASPRTWPDASTSTAKPSIPASRAATVASSWSGTKAARR